jgi:hypothetical protein
MHLSEFQVTGVLLQVCIIVVNFCVAWNGNQSRSEREKRGYQMGIVKRLGSGRQTVLLAHKLLVKGETSHRKRGSASLSPVKQTISSMDLMHGKSCSNENDVLISFALSFLTAIDLSFPDP